MFILFQLIVSDQDSNLKNFNMSYIDIWNINIEELQIYKLCIAILKVFFTLLHHFRVFYTYTYLYDKVGKSLFLDKSSKEAVVNK